MRWMIHVENEKLIGRWLEKILFVTSKLLTYSRDYVEVDEAVIDKR